MHVYLCISAGVCQCQCINSAHLFLLKEYCGSLCKFQYMQPCQFIFSVTCWVNTCVIVHDHASAHVCLWSLSLYVAVGILIAWDHLFLYVRQVCSLVSVLIAIPIAHTCMCMACAQVSVNNLSLVSGTWMWSKNVFKKADNSRYMYADNIWWYCLCISTQYKLIYTNRNNST